WTRRTSACKPSASSRALDGWPSSLRHPMCRGADLGLGAGARVIFARCALMDVLGSRVRRSCVGLAGRVARAAAALARAAPVVVLVTLMAAGMAVVVRGMPSAAAPATSPAVLLASGPLDAA